MAGSIPYAVSPVVTAGSVVVADLSAWTPAILSVFRSSGRFGWLPMYVVFVAALATMVTRLPGRAAAAAVAAALALQTWDLHGAYADLRARATIRRGPPGTIHSRARSGTSRCRTIGIW